MTIVGLADRTIGQVEAEVAAGARFVVYQWCVSLLIITIKRASQVYYIAPGESRLRPGAIWTTAVLVAGWWGIPWGPIYSIQSLVINFRGGRDVTFEVMRAMTESSGSSPE